MMSPTDYVYRFLEYLLVQSPEALQMKFGYVLKSDWMDWATWLLNRKELSNHSRSQVGQDLFAAYILEKKFDLNSAESKGTFIEFGAFDGVMHSNSFLFEQLGWNGILIEPDPLNAKVCEKNRTSQVIQACVMGNNFSDDTVKFRAVSSDGELSSVVGYGKSETSGMESQEYEVPVVNLDELLNSLGAVDLLSIDTEGTELDLLQNTLFSVRPKVLIVEHNNDNKIKKAIRSLMAEKNYACFERVGDFFDDYFYDTKG